jgi:chromosome segregation ATPase
MENGFDVLEEKVRKAADLVKRLRKENHSLEEGLAEARARLDEAEKRLASVEAHRGSAEKGRAAEQAGRELEGYRREREEIKKRIARIVEILDALD